MTELIYNIFAILGEGGIIWAVVLLLVVLFVTGLRNPGFRQAAPGLMTSLGILGTFCGIFIALYPLDFSPGKMNDSVEALLNGMRTAFVTSLLGIAASIIFRVLTERKPPQIPQEQREILDLLHAIYQSGKATSDALENNRRESGELLRQLIANIQLARDQNVSLNKHMESLKKTATNINSIADELRERPD